MSKLHKKGQSLVETALVLPILMLLMLGIIEGAHLIQSYLSAQNAVKETARYAVAGNPLVDGNPWVGTPADRAEAIKTYAIGRSIGTGYTHVATDIDLYEAYEAETETCGDRSCDGLLAVRVDWVYIDDDGNTHIYDDPSTSELDGRDHPGIEGSDMRVSIYHNVAIWDPVYAAMVPNGYVRVRGQIVMRNEGGTLVPSGGIPGAGEGETDPGAGEPIPSINVYPSSQTAGSSVVIELTNHHMDLGTDYKVYIQFAGVLPTILTPNADGYITTTYTIPTETPPGGYTVESRDATSGAAVAQTTLVVVAPDQPDLYVDGGDSWPYGSPLEYTLVNHDSNTDYNLDIKQGSTVLHTDDTPPTDDSGTVTSIYHLPHDKRYDWGVGNFILESTGGVINKTRTVNFMIGCANLNEKSCEEQAEMPNGETLYITLNNHAPDRLYNLYFNNQYVADVTTNINGVATYSYFIPENVANGVYNVETYDSKSFNPVDPAYVVAKTPVDVNTPDGPFIHVDHGYVWPAGSTILFHLRKHAPNTQYDIFWLTPSGEEVVITNASPTDANGSVWLSFTIPESTPPGTTYKLASKEHSNSPTPGNYVAETNNIEVTSSAYIEVVEGSPQIPGSEITIKIGNHAFNTQYDIYMSEGSGPGVKVSDVPVTTNSQGVGELLYTISQEFLVGQNLKVRSYPKDTTAQWVAETDLELIGADLQVLSIDVPENIEFNTDVTVTVTIINNSAVSITNQSFDVDVYLDPVVEPDLGRSLPPGEFKTWIQPTLGAYETTTFDTVLPIYGNFDHTLWGRADTSNRISESNEENNLLSKTLSATACEVEYGNDAFSTSGNEITSYVTFGDADDTAGTLIDKLRLRSTGSGIGIANYSTFDSDDDGGYYIAYRQMSGDFDVEARILADHTSNVTWGLEIRNGSSPYPTAAKMSWGYHGNKLKTAIRKEDGGGMSLGPSVSVPHPGTTPVWIRLKRTGTVVKMFNAVDNGDGTHGPWVTTHNDKDVILGTDVLVGLYSASRSEPSLVNFDVTDFKICTVNSECSAGNVLYEVAYDGTIDVGWNTHAFGDSNTPAPDFLELAESQSVYNPAIIEGDNIILHNSGSGTWESDDNSTGSGFLFAYHQISGNFDVWVKTVSHCEAGYCPAEENSKFGLEIRTNVADSAADKIDLVNQYHASGNEIQHQYRKNGSRLSTDVNNGSSAPTWLRIVRTGDTFTLYYAFGSVDPTPPTEWLQHAVVNTTGMPQSLYVGLINSAYHPTTKKKATFSNYHACINPSGGGGCSERRESNGLVVLNAGAYAQQDDHGNPAWEATSRNGNAGMWVPDNGNDYKTIDYATTAPELQYNVDFTSPGRYYIWILGSKPDGEGNSVHIGLTNNPPSKDNYMTMDSGNANILNWFNNSSNGINYIDIDAVGSQTISMWAREDGFEIYQIVLSLDESFSPDENSDPNTDDVPLPESQCSGQKVEDPPPGMTQCVDGITNGDFEDSAMLEWHYAGIAEQVTRTTSPHYYGPGEFFSMMLPATNLGGPRHPWLWQEFQMPTWVLTPTINGAGTKLSLSYNVGVNPEGLSDMNDPEPLDIHLRNQVGQQFGPSVTGPIQGALDTDTPTLNPLNPDPNNADWLSKQVSLAYYFNPVDYQGESMRLFFESENPNNDYSVRFYLDNVVLDICTTQPEPSSFSTKVSGIIQVMINGQPAEMPGIYVWTYAVDGEMAKTYTIHDSTFSFYDLPADAAGTEYILYAEYWENGKLYTASQVYTLHPGEAIEDILLLLF